MSCGTNYLTVVWSVRNSIIRTFNYAYTMLPSVGISTFLALVYSTLLVWCVCYLTSTATCYKLSVSLYCHPLTLLPSNMAILMCLDNTVKSRAENLLRLLQVNKQCAH